MVAIGVVSVCGEFSVIIAPCNDVSSTRVGGESLKAHGGSQYNMLAALPVEARAIDLECVESDEKFDLRPAARLG